MPFRLPGQRAEMLRWVSIVLQISAVAPSPYFVGPLGHLRPTKYVKEKLLVTNNPRSTAEKVSHLNL